MQIHSSPRAGHGAAPAGGPGRLGTGVSSGSRILSVPTAAVLPDAHHARALGAAGSAGRRVPGRQQGLPSAGCVHGRPGPGPQGPGPDLCGHVLAMSGPASLYKDVRSLQES